MNIQTHKEPTRTLITIQGEIDEVGAEEIKRCFRDLQVAGQQEVAIDLAGVSHIGSAGIGKLLVLYKDLAMRGVRLSLVRVPRPIFQLLREMKLDTLFSISELNGTAQK